MPIRTISQSINLQAQPKSDVDKYITEITDDGITVHPVIPANQTATNYLHISNNMNIVRNNISVAEYGANVRIGKEEGTKVIIADGSISPYTTAGTYIVDKVSNNDIILSSFTAAGIQIGQDTTAHVIIDSGNLTMYSNTLQPAFGIKVADELLSKAWYFDETRTIANNSSVTITLEKQSDGIFNTDELISVTTDDDSQVFYEWGNSTPVDGSESGTGIFSIAYNGSIDNPQITWTNTSGISQSIHMKAQYYVKIPAPYAYIGKREWPSSTAEQTAGGLSLTVGQWQRAAGACSFSAGQLNRADADSSFCLGVGNHTSGYGSAAIGIGLEAVAGSQTVVGYCNTPDEDEEYAFIVGIGEDQENTANGFTVDWSGNINIPAGAHYQINGTGIDGIILYDNDDTSLATSVSLSDSAANYEKFEICYKNNDGRYQSVTVYHPNGKTIDLIGSTPTSSYMYIKSAAFTINGSTISFVGAGEARIATPIYTYQAAYIAITQVIGYKHI